MCRWNEFWEIVGYIFTVDAFTISFQSFQKRIARMLTTCWQRLGNLSVGGNYWCDCVDVRIGRVKVDFMGNSRRPWEILNMDI